MTKSETNLKAKVLKILNRSVCPLRADKLKVKRAVILGSDRAAFLFTNGQWTTLGEQGWSGYLGQRFGGPALRYAYAAWRLGLLTRGEYLGFEKLLARFRQEAAKEASLSKIEEEARNLGFCVEKQSNGCFFLHPPKKGKA